MKNTEKIDKLMELDIEIRPGLYQVSKINGNSIERKAHKGLLIVGLGGRRIPILDGWDKEIEGDGYGAPIAIFRTLGYIYKGGMGGILGSSGDEYLLLERDGNKPFIRYIDAPLEIVKPNQIFQTGVLRRNEVVHLQDSPYQDTNLLDDDFNPKEVIEAKYDLESLAKLARQYMPFHLKDKVEGGRK